jgi:hypothetical protein
MLAEGRKIRRDSMTDDEASQAWLRDEVMGSLERLAAPAPAQLDHLAALGSADLADELALELDSVLEAFLALGPEGGVSSEAGARLKALDDKFDQISGEANAHLWEPDAVRDAPEWREVRELASRALRALGATPATSR